MPRIFLGHCVKLETLFIRETKRWNYCREEGKLSRLATGDKKKKRLVNSGITVQVI